MTSTTERYGIVPPVNGRPFTSTVPVGVPVGGGAAPPPDVVVVVPPPPPDGAPASGNVATKSARSFPPAFVKLPPATRSPPNVVERAGIAVERRRCPRRSSRRGFHGLAVELGDDVGERIAVRVR